MSYRMPGTAGAKAECTAHQDKPKLQILTPEEPRTTKDSPGSVGSVGSVGLHGSSPAARSPLESPSVQSTRELEVALAETIQELEARAGESRASTALDVPRLLSVLNQSLTAISHWSLQARLAQLENRSAWDSRLAVENSIIKKEVEFFRNRCLSESHGVQGLMHAPSAPASPSRGVSARVSKPARGNPAKKALSHHARREQHDPQQQDPQHQHAQQPLLRLVENHKPHPRMRRSSDNPSASDFVRVFHLEKL
ncbi:LAQU0S09e02036g1_1 [Lachancea quebecensis]|uniref:LAQU0S09e02036g1_1 n=1 Tax=Lachancea quebecensis TaxID=1654605 RepID=A0A0P1KTN5_9SACH|nr:LAQU0S09e02036g1_1 [Lachancea quebecensis]